MNGGWIQFAGPISRIADWKFIETTQFGSALQQVRYPPTRAAYTRRRGSLAMFMLPGAIYVDPEFSWQYEIGPAGATFVLGNALGPEYDGTLWMGSARSFEQVGDNGGSLYRFKLTADRLHVDVSADPRLADRVADNLFRDPEIRRHRERDAADRHRLRHHARHRARAGRQPLRRLDHRQRDLQDQPTGSVTWGRSGRTPASISATTRASRRARG